MDRPFANRQFRKFCAYGFLKNLRFFEPFLLLFLLENRITFFEAGVLYAVQAIAVNILEIPSGLIADSWGRRKVLAAGFAAYVLSFLLFYFGSSLHVYLLAFILFGIGDALRSGVHKSMILQYLDIKGLSQMKVEAYGRTRSWSQRGSAVSAIIAAILVILHGDMRYVFIYSAIPSLADLFLILSYPKELDGYLQRGKTNVWHKFSEAVKSFASTMQRIPTLKTTLNASMLTAYHQSAKDYLQPVLKSVALSLPLGLALSDNDRQALLIGIVYSLIFLLSAMASRNAYRLAGSDSRARKSMNYLLLTGLMAGVVAGLIYNTGSYWIPVALLVLIRLFVNMRRPMSMAVLSSIYRRESMASGLSAESQLQTLLTFLFAPLLGWIADTWGLGTGLWALSVLLLLPLPFIWIRGARATEPVR